VETVVLEGAEMGSGGGNYRGRGKTGRCRNCGCWSYRGRGRLEGVAVVGIEVDMVTPGVVEDIMD
jgi:hypothetical protein